MIDGLITHTTCRSCGGSLVEVLNLGDHRLNAFPATWEDLRAVPSAPLVLTVCTQCSLAQLQHTVPPDLLYRTYWYKSGVNESMVAELQTIVREACAQVPIGATDYVLDIGANDGTLLAEYRQQPYAPIRAAVEPAQNLHPILARQTDILVKDYFPTPDLDPLKGRFKVITAIACAYDLEDPRAFFEKIAQLLHPNGVVILQFQDLLQQLQSTAFDNIVHEHLEYYTLGSLLTVVKTVGLAAVKVQTTPINGGSLRVTLRHVRHTLDRDTPTVYQQLEREATADLSVKGIRQENLYAFEAFRVQIQDLTCQIHATLDAAGSPIDWYGASTKSNCSLQVLGLGPDQIRQAVDRNPEKHGRLTITGIPIVSEDQWVSDPAPLTLLGIWQFTDFVLQREWGYLQRGGTFLVPMPHATLIKENW